MKAQTFSRDPQTGKMTKIELTPEQLAKTEEAFKRNFWPDFTPRFITRLNPELEARYRAQFAEDHPQSSP